MSHFVFTDSTEKQAAVEQLIEQYINQQTACNYSDLSDCLLKIHNNKNAIKNTDTTRKLCNKNNITILRIPPNATAWLQPCDVLLCGPAKNKVRKAMRHALNTDERPSILMSCDELHKADHEVRSEDIIQCWMNIAHRTIDELKGKSASSSLKRSRSAPIPTQSQHNNN